MSKGVDQASWSLIEMFAPFVARLPINSKVVQGRGKGRNEMNWQKASSQPSYLRIESYEGPDPRYLCLHKNKAHLLACLLLERRVLPIEARRADSEALRNAQAAWSVTRTRRPQ